MPGKPPRHTPGRGSNRPGAKREQRVTSSPSDSETVRDSPQAHAEARSRVISALALGTTHRLIALAVTAAVLLISFVSSYSVYLGQQQDIAEARAEIAAHRSEITRLQDELDRWQDPAYVRAQARERLGWVMPGEVGYRVIDENGDVIGGTVGTLDEANAELTTVWYDTLWKSLQAADQPAPDPSTNPSGPATFSPDDPESPR